MLPTNTAPVITTSVTRVSIEANEWSSLVLSSMFGLVLSDIDTSISTFGQRPLRLLVLTSPQGLLSTYGTAAQITAAEAAVYHSLTGHTP